MKPDPVIVKYRSVSITIRLSTYADGRPRWRFTRANGKRPAFVSLDKAKTQALLEAQTMHRGVLDLAEITPEQARACRRMIDADPSCRLVDEFLLWYSRRAPRKMADVAVAEFLASKEANRGLSAYNVQNLTRHLKSVPVKPLADIVPKDFPELEGEPRTRANRINAWITFFRWCVRQEYLPTGQLTSPERIEKPRIVRGAPAIFTPKELKILLAKVDPKYLGWLACAAYGGFRSEEICPDRKSRKTGLQWEDFAWDRDLIIVPASTAKTGRRRIVPILPALRAILWPLRGTGPIGPKLPPHKPQKGRSNARDYVPAQDGKPSVYARKAYPGKEAETTRLGRFVGGWRNNALRHSWLSYRAAIVGISQTAMEAGNSESEARKSYIDAVGRDEAEAWFSVHPA